MGGQVADHGQILDESGSVVAKVTNVQKAPNGQALHTVEVLAPLALNQEYTLAIDTNRRHRVMKKPHCDSLASRCPSQYPWKPCDTSRFT